MTELDNARKVDKFCDVFLRYVDEVATGELGSGACRYRKILYFSLLEAMAKARYPRKRAGAAFSSFVVRHCGWESGDRVSLPHLVAALERTSEAEFDELRRWAYPRLTGLGSGGPLSIDDDPSKSEVQRRWPRAENGKTLEIEMLRGDWTLLQHRRLLYAYRSKLVHEAREQTMSFEDGSEAGPFYESLSRVGQPLTQWQLVYPATFLESQCRNGIEGLRKWFAQADLNPYGRFSFGRFLVEKLNDPSLPILHPCA